MFSEGNNHQVKLPTDDKLDFGDILKLGSFQVGTSNIAQKAPRVLIENTHYKPCYKDIGEVSYIEKNIMAWRKR